MDDIVARATALVATHGAWAGPIIGLLSLGESLAIVGLFIPATTIMLAIGGLLATGVLDPAPIVLWAIGGAIVGDWISYWAGRRIGPSIYRRWPLKNHRPMVARARLFFRKYGFTAVFLGRFLGPIRATVPLVAGVVEMRGRPFQLANIASAAIWVPLMFMPGVVAVRILGPDAQISERDVLLFGTGIAVFTLVATVVMSRLFGGKRRTRRRRG